MKKILYSISVIALVIGLSVGITGAYFTGQDELSPSVFTSGTLDIELQEASQLSVDNFLPGQTIQTEFTLRNTGSVPIKVKGYIDGEWVDSDLNLSVITINKLDRLDGTQWLPLLESPLGIGDEFFIADSQENLLQIRPGETIGMRAEYEFSSSAGNEYQGKLLNLSIHAAAKQANPEGSWPSDY